MKSNLLLFGQYYHSCIFCHQDRKITVSPQRGEAFTEAHQYVILFLLRYDNLVKYSVDARGFYFLGEVIY